ncbi:hypothetical protein GCM10008022_23720 [Paenibacillus hunanensis]|uniref:Uncharacterized protein n=1 Tax=Paenibacillus hunanensis TaxID=539262 RepID=A0ABU1J371_9BACL|nr:hypothetical protein [Paenibacillus hunanensis]GGJ13996.1 hypothetical protein GCM10008022_23720 [Paenibacillus hunanensis]
MLVLEMEENRNDQIIRKLYEKRIGQLWISYSWSSLHIKPKDKQNANTAKRADEYSQNVFIQI